MSIKLRELIRAVRACKSAAQERAVIAKECALIRTMFKEKLTKSEWCFSSCSWIYMCVCMYVYVCVFMCASSHSTVCVCVRTRFPCVCVCVCVCSGRRLSTSECGQTTVHSYVRLSHTLWTNGVPQTDSMSALSWEAYWLSRSNDIARRAARGAHAGDQLLEKVCVRVCVCLLACTGRVTCVCVCVCVYPCLSVLHLQCLSHNLASYVCVCVCVIHLITGISPIKIRTLWD